MYQEKSGRDSNPSLNNPVAKHMGKFNKAATHKSKKDYQRKPKHKNKQFD